MSIKDYIAKHNELFGSIYPKDLNDKIDLCNIGTDFASQGMFEDAVGMWLELIRSNMATPDVYCNLGVSCFYGNGVEQNEEKAVHYYQLAAAKGHPFGQYNYAVALEQGNGVARDLEKAIHFYTLAAQRNVTPAIDALKRLKTNFNSTDKKDAFSEGTDFIAGDEYLQLCSKIEDYVEEWACTNENCHYNIVKVPLIFDKNSGKAIVFDDIISLINKALSIKPSPALYYTKGNMYRYNREYDIAIDCYKKCIELDSNDYQALGNLGVMYYNKKEDDLALDCFLKSAAIHPTSFMYRNVGNAYTVLGDKNKAEEYYQLAEVFDDIYND